MTSPAAPVVPEPGAPAAAPPARLGAPNGLTTPASRPVLLMLVVLMAVGMAARLIEFAARRSLWLDEAMVALNVASRSFAGLLRPLDYSQNAPVLFLWAGRAAVTLFGVSEWSLRAPALVAGLALLPATWWVARRLLSPGAAVLAVAVVALSPVLVYYSNEVKPYESDALVAALLVGAALALLEAPERAGRWRALWAAGAVALWASSPALFVLGGAGLALLASPAARRTKGFWRRIVVTAVVWGTSFATVFLAFLHHTTNNRFLQRYFEGLFLTPGSPHVLDRVGLAVGGTVSGAFFHRDLFDVTVPALRHVYVAAALALCVMGAAALARRRGAAVALLLTAPIVAALAASVVRMYPVTARLMAYAIPLLAILASAGISACVERLPARWRRQGLALGGALFMLPAAYHAGQRARDPLADVQEHSRPVIAALTAEGRTGKSGEPVYVLAQGIPQWLFYSTDWSAPDTARLRYYATVARPPDGPALQNAPSRGRPVSVGEGFSVSYDNRGRVELPALYSGVEPRPGFEEFSRSPDLGWAENEAERIRRAAHPCARLLTIASVGGERSRLHGALERAGATLTTVRSSRNARDTRVCFRQGRG